MVYVNLIKNCVSQLILPFIIKVIILTAAFVYQFTFTKHYANIHFILKSCL